VVDNAPSIQRHFRLSELVASSLEFVIDAQDLKGRPPCPRKGQGGSEPRLDRKEVLAVLALGMSVLDNSGLSILSGTIAGATTVLTLVRWTNRRKGQL
jgi:hypothetical protein